MNNKVPDNTIIMGIDPGTNITGFGVIRIKNNQMELVDLIEFKLSKKNDHSAKLSEIFNKTSELIKQHNQVKDHHTIPLQLYLVYHQYQ